MYFLVGIATDLVGIACKSQQKRIKEVLLKTSIKITICMRKKPIGFLRTEMSTLTNRKYGGKGHFKGHCLRILLHT